MENVRKIKTVIGLLAAILVFELIMLCFMIRPLSLFVILTLGVLLVVNIYLVVISLSLIKVIQKQSKQE